jgi:hypothetical protein
MSAGGRAYVVRDTDPGTATDNGDVARIYPYTLDGLRQALDEARLRSYGGRPQVLAVVAGEHSRVIRRYERGREVPVPPLPPAVADHVASGPPPGSQIARRGLRVIADRDRADRLKLVRHPEHCAELRHRLRHDPEVHRP